MLTTIGDSIIKGVILNDNNSERRYQVAEHSITDRLTSMLHTDILNLGRFGCTAPLGERIADKNLLRIGASRYVLIELGGNDSDYNWTAIADNPESEHEAKTPLYSFIHAYDTIVKKILAVGATPVMLTLPPMDADRYYNFFTRTFTEEQKRNVLQWLGGSATRICTGHDLYNLTTAKIARRNNVPLVDITSEFLCERDFSRYLCADGIHPNETGQSRIAEIIRDALVFEVGLKSA